MLRTLFSLRLLGLHVAVIGVLVSFTLLGNWQLGRFEDSGQAAVDTDPAPVAVTQLSKVGQAMLKDGVGRRVTATGEYVADRQLLVANRSVKPGNPGDGYWILTPLRLSDGSMMPIVRGWVADARDPSVAVPSGRVTVTGRLQPSEPTDTVRRKGALPPGQVYSVSTGELVNLWPGVPVRDGFVADQAARAPVQVLPPAEIASFNWRNLAYAAQWWIFGLFAVYMWFHFVRDAVRQAAARERAGEAGEPGEAEGAEGAQPQAPAPA
ncbi:SURF1 family protein [Bailinhaonella thermotolerans]|uniref:SURF1-like protein n=1 Tax=Bailinhaonella thermotolerans TaxID=1070861 RepID=A0A3A4ATB1_9ACTN|nr:SURF1 family protein [Bailinhaonella thermotolerans]RJL30544.1 SURF1 family protein [Bailinhaonella thermotolerans]